MKIGFSTSVIQRGKTGVSQYVFALLKAFHELQEDHQFVLFVLEEDEPFFSHLRDRFQIELVSEKFRPPIKNIIWHQTILPRLAKKTSVGCGPCAELSAAANLGVLCACRHHS